MTSKIVPWPPHQKDLQQQNQAHLVSSAIGRMAMMEYRKSTNDDSFVHNKQISKKIPGQHSPSSSPPRVLPALLETGFAGQVEGEQRDTW